MVFLMFDTMVPEYGCMVEVSRLCTPVEHARRIVEVLAKTLDYYPARPGEVANAAKEAQ